MTKTAPARDLPRMEDLVELVRCAGDEILPWYGEGDRHQGMETKGDGSPLTEADRAAHAFLARELARLGPGVPVLSEESPPPSAAERQRWPRHWLVDPLDGTKEFLKGTGEFTVNVALIEDGRPVLGVVHVPAEDRTYTASRGHGARVGSGAGPFEPIRTRTFPPEAPVLVGSRDHAGPGVDALARALGDGVRFASVGSSLKFCLVAEGRADLYLRDKPTMEWDTGAAQCVVEQAGGAVYAADSDGEEPLRYNKSTLENPPFLAVGDPSGPWRELMQRSRNGS